MSGHSKWANIKHRKAKMDAQKGRLYSKLTREIIMAAKQGGPNPESNPRLRLAVQKAREADLPMENINRAISRGAGQDESTRYEEFTYEGYAPGGVALLLEIVTDNRNRTASEIRHIFSRFGGNLGETGCVAWMFEKKGYVVIDGKASNRDEDDLLMLALEAGAEDFKKEGDSYSVITNPEELQTVREVFSERHVKIVHAELTMIPKTTVPVNGKEAEQVLKLIDALDDHEDVQGVYANYDIPEEEIEKYSSSR